RLLRGSRLANTRARSGKISARESLRRLFESVVLARLGAARSRGASAGLGAFKIMFGRVHRDRWAQSDCRSSIGRRLRDFSQTRPFYGLVLKGRPQLWADVHRENTGNRVNQNCRWENQKESSQTIQATDLNRCERTQSYIAP